MAPQPTKDKKISTKSNTTKTNPAEPKNNKPGRAAKGNKGGRTPAR